MYLISLCTNDPNGIVQNFANCKQGFEFSVQYGVPQPPPDGPGGAISFWPGALVGTPNYSDWLFQPLLTQDEGTSGWLAAPAVWIQNPDGSTAAQLGWADGVHSEGSTMFVPRPGDLMKSSISYDKATGIWKQSMHDVTTGDFFDYFITAGNTYRNEYVCPDNTMFELIYFTIECAYAPTKNNIWQNKIDAYSKFIVDDLLVTEDFANANEWTGTIEGGVSGVSFNLGLNHFTMNLPQK